MSDSRRMRQLAAFLPTTLCINMLPKKTYARTLSMTDKAVVVLRGETQKPPYNLICSLDNVRCILGRTYASPDRSPPSMKGAASMDLSPFSRQSLVDGVNNLAYKRMVDKLGDASSLGATLTAERRETWGLVVSTVTRALRAARSIRKLKFGQAARELGLPYHERTVVKRHAVKLRNGRRRVFKVKSVEFTWHQKRWYAKEIGSGWLMYSYGVAPLMGDIYNGIDILQREFPSERIFGFAKDVETLYDRFNRPGIYTSWTTEYSCRQSVDVRVKNPNLWLANRMGLVNPMQWVLEAIPFSFVVDWFSNLSDVVMQMTDFVGLETSNPCSNSQRVFVWKTANRWSNNDYLVYDWTRVNQVRRLGLVLPKLRFAYERFQWQRGANAISLLLGLLKAK